MEPAAVGVAQWAVEAQAQRLDVEPTDPPRHDQDTLPAAFASLSDRYGTELDEEARLALDRLDGSGLVAEELRGVVEAFLSLEEASRTQPVAGVGEPSSLIDARALALDRGQALEEPTPSPERFAARTQLLQAVGALEQALASDGAPSSACSPIQVVPAFSVDLGVCDNTYTEDYALIVDAGGHDTYENNAGGSGLSNVPAAETNPCLIFPPGVRVTAALVDLGDGDDAYGDADERRECGANGGATAGTGFLYDGGGDDTYVAAGFGTNGGGSIGGLGLLVDAGGNDTYRATELGTNGGGNGGTGLLFDVSGNDRYRDNGLDCTDCYRIPKGVAGALVDSNDVAGLDLEPLLPDDIPAPSPSCLEHPPIHIAGDSGFLAPDSGVVYGAGTADAPFVIENWCITPDPELWPSALVDTGPDAALRIEDTSAHVLVRANELPAEGSFDHGVHLDNAENVRLVRNTVQDNADTGILLEDVRETQIENNTIDGNDAHGVHLRQARTTTLGGNSLTGNAGDAIRVQGGEANVILDHKLEGHGYGLVVDGARGTHVDGIEVRDNTDDGVRLVDAVATTVVDSLVQDNGGSGLLAEASGNLTVRSSTLTGHPGPQVRLDDAPDVRLAHNAITDGEDHGVQAQDAPRLVLEDNGIHGHALDGIHLDHAPGARLAANQITDNGDGGLTFDGGPTSPEAVVRDNRIAGNDGTGLALAGTPGAALDNNTVEANAEGVRLERADDALVLANAIERNDGTGLHGTDSAGLVLRDNRIHGNGADGVSLAGTPQAVLAANDLSANGGRGLGLVQLEGVHLSGNEVRDNDASGVHGFWTRDVLVADNDVAGNGGDGVRLSHSHLDTVRDNGLSDNAGAGVVLADADRSTVQANTATSNEVGLALRNLSGGLASRNTVTDHGGPGVLVDATVESTLLANDVRGNADEGIRLTDSSRNELEANDVRTNGGVGIHLENTTGAAVADNNTLRNNHLEANLAGVALSAAHGTLLDANTLVANEAEGVRLAASDDSRLSNNSVEDNTLGILLSDAQGNRLSGNDVVANGDGVILEATGSTGLEANQVRSNGGTGLAVRNASDVELVGNDVVANGDGVVVKHTQVAQIEANTARANNGSGVLLEVIDHVQFSKNTVQANDGAGLLLETIDLAQASNNTVQENGAGIRAEDVEASFVANEVLSNDGLGLSLRSGDFTVRGNDVSQNGRGLQVLDSPGVSVQENTVSNQTEWGVRARHSDGIEVLDNEIRHNGGDGLTVNRSEVLVQNNSLSGNGGDGASILATPAPTVVGNRMADNVRGGLLLDATPDAEVAWNVVHSNRNNIALDVSNRTWIHDNTITDADWIDGININGSADVRIQNNTIRGNERDGVRTYEDGGSLHLSDNVLADSKHGLHLGTGGSLVEHNVIKWNSDAGVVATVRGNVIRENLVADNIWWGIALEPGSRNATVAQNTVTRSFHHGINVAGGNHTVRGNEITESGYSAIRVREAFSGSLAIHGNDVHGNGVLDDDRPALGISADVTEPVDARDNWWGHATGPSSGPADACTGTVPDGEGGAIGAGTGEVCFDPWLGEPNADAWTPS